MSKKKSLFLSLSLVLIVGLSIVAGTFAYFQWQAATGTEVNVTIEMGGITMNIEPEATGFVGLYPTAHCINNVRYGDALVTIENKTGALAIPSFKLKVAVNPSVPDTGKLNDYKDNIHYAVVALETNKDGSKKLSNGNVITVGGNTIDELVTGTCSVPLNVSNADDNDNTFKSDYGKTATGLFDVITAEKTFADTAFLPREYNSTTGKVQGVTFRGEAYSTSYQWYRVYVWIDENYTTTIIGNEVSDPLQNAQIQVTWSENSMLQQVSGESIVDNEPTLDAGLYDLDNNMVKTWDELLNDGDITLDGTIIENSNKELNGMLVIPAEITEIGDMAFEQSSIKIVEFEKNSLLTTIDGGAFYNSSLVDIRLPKNLIYIRMHTFSKTSITQIKIPASVMYIDDWAFKDCNLLTSIEFDENSQLLFLGDESLSNTRITEIKIPSSVTTIEESVFYDCTDLDKIIYDGTIQEWNAIEKGSEWDNRILVVEVICSDGVVTLKVPGLYNANWELQYTWSQLLANGDIVLEENVLVDSNRALMGNLIMGDGVIGIESRSFGSVYNNDGDFVAVSLLTNIVISSTVTYIGAEAFWECPNLDSITFTSNSQLKNIGSYAFERSSLKIIKLPNNLEYIGEEAFVGTMLASIKIPVSVTHIGINAFSCDLLSIVIFDGTMAEWNAIEKYYDSLGDIPATYVQCTDGMIDL